MTKNIKTYAKDSKQKAKNAIVSRQKSHALIRNMVRIGISTISKVRNLWQDDLFSKVDYGGAEIHQLESAEVDQEGNINIKNIEAFRLTQWLERGVFDAIEREYLKSVKFFIQTKHPLTDELITLEAYEFAIAYESTEGTPASINGQPLTSSDGLKAQARRFLKTLYDFASTLDELPQDRCLSMMLKYHDNCPPEYEPEFFKSADGKALDLNSSLTVVKLGSVIAPDLNMHLSYTGLDSLDYAELCKVGFANDILMETENSLRNMSVGTKSILCASAKTPKGDEISVGQAAQENPSEIESAQHDERENENVPVESSPVPSEVPLIDQLKQYLLENGECKTAVILKSFNFDKTSIGVALTKLKKEGTANNPRKGIWTIVEKQTIVEKHVKINEPPVPTPAAQEEQVVIEPPPAPKKRDRVEKSKQEENPRQSKPQPIDSPVAVVVNSPIIEDIITSIPSTGSSGSKPEGAKRRKFSIAVDSLHLLKGVNDGFQKSPPDASQVHKLLFHD